MFSCIMYVSVDYYCFLVHFNTMITKNTARKLMRCLLFQYTNLSLRIYDWKLRSRRIRIQIDITYIHTLYGLYYALKMTDKIGPY